MRIFLLLLVLSLTACAIPVEKRLAMDKKTCSDYGFKPGTKDFSSCLLTIDQNRKNQDIQQSQAAAANLQATGAFMSGISSMQPRNGTNCTTNQYGTSGSISCR